MSLNFNSRGDLYKTISLTYDELIQHLGFNQQRLRHLENAMPFFRIFYNSGCTIVYIGGSFASQKRIPEDIDICFDLTGVDPQTLEKEFPKYADYNEIGRIRRDLKTHIFLFDKENTELFDLLNEDRDGNRKGLIKVALKDILQHHDQKRETI